MVFFLLWIYKVPYNLSPRLNYNCWSLRFTVEPGRRCHPHPPHVLFGKFFVLGPVEDWSIPTGLRHLGVSFVKGSRTNILTLTIRTIYHVESVTQEPGASFSIVSILCLPSEIMMSNSFII